MYKFHATVGHSEGQVSFSHSDLREVEPGPFSFFTFKAIETPPNNLAQIPVKVGEN